MIYSIFMSEVSKNFVIESPVQLHLRPMGDIVRFFEKLMEANPTVRACLQLDSLDPDFDPEKYSEQCDDPSSMMQLTNFFFIVQGGFDTRNRFKVVLRGQENIVDSLAQSAQTELQALANTWDQYTNENRTLKD